MNKQKSDKPNNWTTPEGQARTEAMHVRIDQVEDARRAGIREGLLMAMTAVHLIPGDGPMLDAITDRGDRHFGGTGWRA